LDDVYKWIVIHDDSLVATGIADTSANAQQMAVRVIYLLST